MLNFSSALLDLLLPPSCALCGAFGSVNPCLSCRSAFVSADIPIAALLPEIARSLAVYPFRGAPGEAVRALKFSRRTDLASWMSQEMAAALARSGWAPEIAVPVPIHWRRRAARGFNQSELLCEAIPLARADLSLRRLRHTKSQSRLDPAGRARNLAGAFAADDVAGRSVLLVDDVVTSGHTARECAKSLRTAGAREVLLLTFAFGNP